MAAVAANRPGPATAILVQRGCELGLFLPLKVGNLDCTLCLDCVHACPHDNVGILAVVPCRTLWSDPFRSGIGRFSERPDLAALVIVLTFGAFANAAGMVGPIVEWEDRFHAALGNPLRILEGRLIRFGFQARF